VITFTGPVEPNPAALARFYGQHVSWRPCRDDADFDCASVMVPVDHARPGGGTVRIALRRLPAQGPSRKGTLFVNPGGPGGSGIEFVQEPGFFGKDLRRAWDIVGFDPRGIGESGSFDCVTDGDLDLMYGVDPTPTTNAGQTALEEAAAARVSGCLERGGSLAAHMGSEAVAADLDILREVVGDERLSYYGVSYGTLIGAIYADRFTSRVGLMVLDSAVSPDGLATPSLTQRDVDGSARQLGKEFDALFAAFIMSCNQDGSCPLGHDTDSAGKALIGLLDSLQRAPLPTEFDSLRQLTEGWAVTAISQGLLDAASWHYLVDALAHALEDHDGSDLAWFAMVAVGRDVDGTYPGSSYGKNHLPVICADWPEMSWDRAAPSRQVLDEHPLFARIRPPAPPECKGWTGEQRASLVVRATPPAPVLVIGNEKDPVTMIEETEYLSEVLTGSRLVRVDADVHGSYASGNSCADRAVEDYLVRARLPRPGLECPAS
jgi:pimeloyl-ACP methyl ester carboxylesterase